jgi:DNA-directed RNA polymerase specialized sigma24 family protein
MNPRDELQRIQERLLVLQAQQNDHLAFQQLMKLYEKRLLYYIRRLVDDSDHALDILQNVWLMVIPPNRFPEISRSVPGVGLQNYTRPARQ